ncbi:glycosyltransferase family 4 protein [Microbulbifer sp. YPW1]|uniref:glycosyltransferase family 4 protein n=1 Tax=Microbulbifer sp. YPW1 TaxID=2745199 RepID=UPI00159959AE|nr:glycosyltransferase family 4 protein [Microbulbifer sp. YPW1]QKX16589.1 glycosyltransferase family 4 protein [Microbulbifer sp. YPW1]
MKIAYFVNQYPSVSHSFIRREILALEQKNVDVARFAVKVDRQKVIDPLDKEELKKTRYILECPKTAIVTAVAKCLFEKNVTMLATLVFAMKMGHKSERGILRHIAYFIEAIILHYWLKEQKIQHIHAHFGTNSTTVAMLAAKLGGFTYSFTVHGPEEFDKPAAINLPEKICAAKFVIAISSYCRSQLYRLVDSDTWHKIHIVRCGLDQSFLQEKLEMATTSPSIENNTFVCIGRLCEQKGQLLLVEAVKDVVAAGYPIRLILAGDGPMRPQVERKIAEYNLDRHIEITGWIDSLQVKEYLNSCKAMVLPSFAEGLPVVIMEALAVGKPVITTYIAGIPELVEHREQGWVIPAGSRQRLTEALIEAVQASNTTCEKMGLSGYRKVEQYHNSATEASRLAIHFSS